MDKTDEYHRPMTEKRSHNINVRKKTQDMKRKREHKGKNGKENKEREV